METTPAEHQEKEDIIQESDATSSGDEMSDDESDNTDHAGLKVDFHSVQNVARSTFSERFLLKCVKSTAANEICSA